MTVRNILLIIAIVLFVYAAALVDHSDLWGNPWVVAFVGLATFAAAHLGFRELD